MGSELVFIRRLLQITELYLDYSGIKLNSSERFFFGHHIILHYTLLVVMLCIDVWQFVCVLRRNENTLYAHL